MQGVKSCWWGHSCTSAYDNAAIFCSSGTYECQACFLPNCVCKLITVVQLALIKNIILVFKLTLTNHDFVVIESKNIFAHI